MKLIKRNDLMFLRLSADEAAYHPILKLAYTISSGVSWHKMIGVRGHVNEMAMLLDRQQRLFHADLLGLFHEVGRVAGERLAAMLASGLPMHHGGIADDLLTASGEVWSSRLPWTQEIAGSNPASQNHVQQLRSIIAQHARECALIAATIEWEMHQRRNTEAEVVGFVRKGLMDMMGRLPGRVAAAVTSGVSRVVDNAERMIEIIKERVRDVIADMKHPENREDVRNAVADIFSHEENTKRGMGIVMSESTGAFGVGGKEAARHLADEGLINARRWMTLHGTGNIDNRVRDSHRQANGQTVQVGQQFALITPDGKGLEWCDHPCDPVLSAGNLFHCRCLAIGVSV